MSTNGTPMRIGPLCGEPVAAIIPVIAWIAAARAVAAEAGNPAVNQLWKFCPQHVVADAPFVERARLEILDQDVGALQHFHQHGATALGGEVEPDRALVAIDADEIGGVLAVERRSPVAHLVAGGRLDLDHVGAVIGEDLRAIGSAENPREVDHAQSGHRAGGFFSCHGRYLAKCAGRSSTALSIRDACSQMPGDAARLRPTGYDAAAFACFATIARRVACR